MASGVGRRILLLGSRNGRLGTVDFVSLSNKRQCRYLSSGGAQNGNGQSFNFGTGSKVAVSLAILGAGAAVLLKKSGKDIAKMPAVEPNVDDKKEKVVIDSKNQQHEQEHKVITECRDFIQRIKDETGCPGIVVGVSVDGQVMWSEGLGYADLENRTTCTADTVMRIASISKPITMTIIAKLLEAGKLDLDSPVQKYVPVWPHKTYKGEEVEITLRQLACHLSGIRHYDKTCKKHRTLKNSRLAATKSNIKDVKSDEKKAESSVAVKPTEGNEKKGESSKSNNKQGDNKFEEFYLAKNFKHVKDVLALFKDDELCSKPGTEYLYTTHGWTLISAAAEGASGLNFPTLARQLFKDLGMEKTYLDENEPLIYHRARFYQKNKTGRIVNTPYVDLSCKWAGGGMMSTVGDLLRFGNSMLYSYQYHGQPGSLPSYLHPNTVKLLWTPVKGTKSDWDNDGAYGLGWAVVPQESYTGHGRQQRFNASHTGGAIGASSVLLILPRKSEDVSSTGPSPQGVVVVLMANLPSVGLYKRALDIALKFDKLDL